MPLRPEIIAHRGLPREHPENSLPGFAAALALGVHGVELDVQLTADDVPVVHHDPELGRVGDPQAPLRGRSIRDVPLAELRAFELAPGVGVPTLDDVLALVDGAARVYVEVKAAEADAAVVRRLLGREEWTAVHAFDHRIARRARRLRPTLPIGLLSASYLIDNVAPLDAADARDLWQHWSMIDTELVARVHASQRRIIAWTANEPAVIDSLVALGVDGICTDVPAVAAPIVARIAAAMP